MKSDENKKELKIKAGMKERTIHVDYLARVEGEGAMFIHTKGGKVEEVELQIFEPPRFFEGFLRGRPLTDAPDITARICGICPVAYQMSSVNAMEDALGIEMPEYLQQTRRLLYCGEWIESHTLHILMLHAPDFLHMMDVVALAKDHPEIVKRGLSLKKAGNDLIKTLGGREIHPINVRVGGFYHLPKREEILKLVPQFEQARADALALVKWVSKLPFPRLERAYESVSTGTGEEYPMARGNIVSSSGLNIPVQEYEKHFQEEHVKRSNALHSIMLGKGAYLTGPMARYNLYGHLLPSRVQDVIKEIGFEKNCNNPFRSIIVRALEVLFACDEVLRILANYTWDKEPPCIPFEFRRATGYGASEAPRGLLFHKYTVNEGGVIKEAKIVAPTSQNQKVIEEDLYDFVSQNLDLNDADLTWKCEQTIRNYDPCISCATHFLKVNYVHE